ncbi:hypothetical protein HPY86_03205 [candidate division WOR-3 bacterium]|nr:hypothetical protein [candidate division WOR-3 bacterium]
MAESQQTKGRGYSRKLAEEFCALSRRILREANMGVPRSEFTRLVLKEFMDFSGCDQVELRVNEGIRYYRGVLSKGTETDFNFTILTRDKPELSELFQGLEEEAGDLLELYRELVRGQFDASQPCFTSNGAFWVNDTAVPVAIKKDRFFVIGGEFRSLAILSFSVAEDSHGLVFLKSRKPNFFRNYEVEFYQGVAQTLGVAIADRQAQAALRERVKELTCLYSVDKILGREKIEPAVALKSVAEILPAAWLYSDIASARIVFDGIEYVSKDYRSGVAWQSADILVRGKKRGVVEVNYCEERPALDEGPFLKEERSLIEAIARELGIFIERWEAKQEKSRLELQLRHADRLATIGQLAAGVAHELNEPLANILGFAQLALKVPGLSEQAQRDIERIVRAALHAREVVGKLMLFARQKPPNRTRVNLNELVTDGLYFLLSRCAKAGIEVVKELSPNLPEIFADPSQLHQVLVNLVVNAIQAMPGGGKLTIATASKDRSVVLSVEDTGVGMTEDVKRQIFVPFFTTKPPGEGTGLGLSVAHGIVTAHGGEIIVKSEPGKGSRFDVVLPIGGGALNESEVIDESRQN